MEAIFNNLAEGFVKYIPWWSIPWIVLVAIAFSIFAFGYWFYKPARQLKKSLDFIVKQLNQHKKDVKIDFDYIKNNIIKEQEPFKHLWKEFSETLHEYKEQGINEIKIRATVPAESFFTKDVIVDSKLNTDFFKHLPGILTGLGIIATFAGLIHGLGGFVPSEDASTVRSSLVTLLGGVKHAFLFSALAILVAMAITFFEKKILAYRYKKVEELCAAIDSLYDMGVGEEYLARLVKASEDSYNQTAQLKDILVNDLKEAFTNLIDKQINVMHQHHHQQIEAAKEQGQNLGNTIAQSINESLAPTLSTLNNVVQKASGEQSSAVSGMLENILTEFMQKIEDTFGSQTTSINDGLNKSIEAISSMQNEISNLINGIKSSSQNAVESMNDKLSYAMEQASNSQNIMNEQMREFVTQIKDLMLNQQTKSQEILDKSINGVLEQLNFSIQKLAEDKIDSQNQAKHNQQAINEQMHESIQQIKDIMLNQQTKSQEVLDKSINGVLEQLNISMQKLAEDRINTQNLEQERQNQLKNKTQELYSDLSNEVSTLVNKIHQSIEKSDNNIQSLQNITTKALNEMSVGAENINQAADKFANSSNSISNVFNKVDSVSTQLNSTSQILDTSAKSVQLAFEQYDKTRNSIEHITREFKSILDNSNAENTVKKDLIKEMESIIGSVRNIEQQSVDYFDKVNDALKQAFESFTKQITTQVAISIKETDTYSSKSMTSLKEIMQELANILEENMPKSIIKQLN